MEELLEKGEIRIGSTLELLWIRARILVALGVITAGTLYGLYWLALNPFTWLTVAFFAITPISGLGINLSYHAFLSHRAFETSRLFKIGMAVLGAINFRGPLIEWVAHHRRHHKYTDIPNKDPHTPLQFGGGVVGVAKGLWWVFIGEKLSRVRTINEAFAPELLEDRDLVIINRLYDFIAMASLVVPGAIAYAITRDAHYALVVSCVLGCMRAALAYFMIAVVVNGWCHLAGTAPFQSRDHSRNLGWLTLPSFGGSLHHTHHVFPRSLYVSLDGELDPFDLLYWGLEKTGLIWNVQRPSPGTIAAKRATESRSDTPHQNESRQRA